MDKNDKVEEEVDHQQQQPKPHDVIVNATTNVLDQQAQVFSTLDTTQQSLRDVLKKATGAIRELKQELQENQEETGAEEMSITDTNYLFEDVCSQAKEIDRILEETDEALNNAVKDVAEGMEKLRK